VSLPGIYLYMYVIQHNSFSESVTVIMCNFLHRRSNSCLNPLELEAWYVMQ